jgi:DNA-binding protein HU-beta
LVGFGTFEVAKRAAREGINPHTQKKIKIKASKAPRFRAGGGFKTAILGDTESTGPRKLKG